jgi:hypothetical protein
LEQTGQLDLFHPDKQGQRGKKKKNRDEKPFFQHNLARFLYAVRNHALFPFSRPISFYMIERIILIS